MQERFITITDARKEIFSLTDSVAKKNIVFTLTEHGLPKVILLSPKRYAFLQQKTVTERELSNSNASPFFPAAWSVRDTAKKTYARDTASLLSIPSSRGEINLLANAKKLAVAQLFVKLAEEYGYSSQQLQLDTCIRIDGYHGNHTIDIDLLLTDEQGNPVALFLVAPFQKYNDLKQRSFRDLFEINHSLKKEYGCDTVRHLVYFSRTVGDPDAKDLWTAIDAQKFSSFSQWKQKKCPAETIFPKANTL